MHSAASVKLARPLCTHHFRVPNLLQSKLNNAPRPLTKYLIQAFSECNFNALLRPKECLSSLTMFEFED